MSKNFKNNSPKYGNTVKNVENSLKNGPKLRKTINKPLKS